MPQPASPEHDRYRAFGDYLRERFGAKVYRVTVDAGFGCPNRDGRLGERGCIYCRTESFTPASEGCRRPIREQMEEGLARVARRYGARLFLAYFQPHTNTYADVATLRRCYDEALVSPAVVGLCIGTRPDCVGDDVLDLIADYARRFEVWLELGLQSAGDRTLERIGRGHTWATFADAVRRARARSIQVCAHVILGLPGEERADMLDTAAKLAAVGIDGVKLHHLHVVRGTPLVPLWQRGEVRMLSPEEYVQLAADFLEYLPARVVVHRLVGECRPDLLVAPRWPVSKTEVVRMIEDEFRRRNTRQGSRAGGADQPDADPGFSA